MSEHQKSELTWVGQEGSPGLEPRIRVELSQDSQPTTSPVLVWEATLGICNKPRCDCSNIFFHWEPPGAPATPVQAPRDFWFSLQEKSICMTPELEQAPETVRLAKHIGEALAGDQEVELRRWFINQKQSIILSTPSSEIAVSNLPDAGDGAMIGFVEVFPWGLSLNFVLNGEDWTVDEQYCVQPGCDCRETMLSFVKMRDAAGRVTTEVQDCPALRYNYRTQQTSLWKTGPTGSPPASELLAALKASHPSLDLFLEKHHLVMQNLYLRQAIHRLAAESRTQGTLPRKIGRNEPCPCGSGRKYKHCCLNKPKPELGA